MSGFKQSEDFADFFHEAESASTEDDAVSPDDQLVQKKLAKRSVAPHEEAPVTEETTQVEPVEEVSEISEVSETFEHDDLQDLLGGLGVEEDNDADEIEPEEDSTESFDIASIFEDAGLGAPQDSNDTPEVQESFQPVSAVDHVNTHNEISIVPAPDPAPVEVTEEQSGTSEFVSEEPEASYNLHLVSRIAATLDAIRDLDEEYQLSANSFISAPEQPTRDEFELVYRSLSAPEILHRTMLALIEASSVDAMERAFYLLALDDEVLISVGSLTQSFSESELPAGLSMGNDKLPYARDLVKGIGRLSEENVKHIVATEAVLASAMLTEPHKAYSEMFGKVTEDEEVK